jgi:outer membrane protein assembly factor BamB
VTLFGLPRLFRVKIVRYSLLTTVLFGLRALAQIAGPVSAPEAAMFRGNLAHTGVYKGPGVPKFNRVKWKFHTDGQVISSPAVADGTVYFGSTDGNLYAVDLESGAQKWKLPLGVRATSSPAVDHGIVYLGTYSGRFYAVDAATGNLKWKFQTEGERRFAGRHLHGSEPAGETMPDPFDFYLSSPAVWGGTVYFGSGDGNVYALDSNSGGLKWKFHTGDVVHASPAISEGTLFIGSWDSYFYALDAASGKEKWRFKTGEDHNIYNQVGIQSSAAVMDGAVYFGCRDSKFYALDANTGAQRWAFDNKGSWVITSPAVRDGRVYFATSDTATLYALDAKSGDPVFSLSFNHWPMFSSPAIAGSFLYIGSHQGKLVAIDLASQKTAWTFETEASRRNGPAVTKPDGTPNYEAVFTDSFYETLVIGVNRLMSVGAMLSSPVVVNDTIYVGSTDGFLYALM